MFPRSIRQGELSKDEIGKIYIVYGWVHRRRDHGGVIFIDLRAAGDGALIQVTFHPENKEVFATAEKIRPEFVLQITGKVVKRPDNMVNKKIATGEIELEAEKLQILNEAKTPPFEIDQDTEVGEEVRLKYRYLDLRRQRMHNNIIKRAKYIKAIRDFLSDDGFYEIETPMLTKSTPEGARDYLVPSRLHPSKFYALPQSPQQYKQLLMVAGFDRYFQIARCMRDEDQRGDRQPEFTQLDLEMSFVEQETILDLMETMFTKIIKELYPHKKFQLDAKGKWPRMSWQEVMDRYGCDKPDLRFDLSLVDVTAEMRASESGILKKAETVRGFCAPGCASYSRQELDQLVELAKKEGAGGLAWFKVNKGALEGVIAKFIPEALQKTVVKKMAAQDGDLLLFVADKLSVTRAALAALRNELGDRLQLKDPDLIAPCFVVDFPLFEETMENGHYAPSHHMFTAPKTEDTPLLDSDPHKVRSWQHDLVWNGYEVGGGSIRIHDRAIQEKIFKLVGFDPKKSKHQFGHMLEAFEYGAPPHGGIAPGIDRMIMILQNEPNIREVMAFPKNQTAQDVMMDAPSDVDDKQLKELHIARAK